MSTSASSSAAAAAAAAALAAASTQTAAAATTTSGGKSRNGSVPNSPLNPGTGTKRKRAKATEAQRTSWCDEFAREPKKYRSIDAFVAAKMAEVDAAAAVPHKATLSRDMCKLYGKDWAAKRGGGGPWPHRASTTRQPTTRAN